MSNDNAFLNEEESAQESSESFDFDELEAKLQGQLEDELAGFEFLQEEKDKIGSPDALGETIKDVVWEQFINQIAAKAGEDFIKENNSLKLNLRKEAHIQTTENFAKGKIATHNTEIDYQERYDKYQSNFRKDENGNVVMHKTRVPERDARGNVIIGNDGKPVMKQVETLESGYRESYDKVRNERGLKGNREKGTAMDETVSVAEIVRDASANAHMTEQERIEFDLSEKNLNEIDARWNSSKGQTPTNEWLDNPNSKGQKPQEVFDNMTDEDVEKLRQKDKEAREEFEKLKVEAEQRSIEAGKKSRKAEAKRIGGKAVRAVVMQLLAELVREIVSKLVSWFKAAKRKLDSLLSALKEAITSFVKKLKTHLVNAADTALTTVASAIWGPIVSTIKKVWIMLKQGWSSLKEAVAYIRNPENKGKPIGILMMEIGKIVIAGMSATGAIALGEVIEDALIAIPVAGAFFSFDIPLLGSLANILGIFLGAVVAGIVGAIAINLLQKKIEKAKKAQIISEQIDKGNEVLALQHQVQAAGESNLAHAKARTETTIKDRHMEAVNIIRDSLENIAANCQEDENIDETHNEINRLFDELEGEL